MENRLILVHGATALSSRNKYIQKLISFIYKYLFNFIPKYNTKGLWLKKFVKSGYNIVELKWSGKIIPYDVPKASRELLHIIDSNSTQNYSFLTESIGTEIVLSAIEASNTKNIKQIISICPVSRPRDIEGFSMISLKSKNDVFAKFSNKLLWPLHFLKSTTGNVENIVLKNIRHDQFAPDFKINKNQTLYELIESKMDDF